MKSSTLKILNAARALEKKGSPITSQSIMEAAGIRDSDRSSAMDISAGWISTLRRYGLLKASRGEKVRGPRRQVQVYVLTAWGRRYKSKAKVKGTLRIAANPDDNQG